MNPRARRQRRQQRKWGRPTGTGYALQGYPLVYGILLRYRVLAEIGRAVDPWCRRMRWVTISGC